MKTIIWFVLGALFATGNSVITEVGQKVTLNCGAGKADRVEWFHENKLIYRLETLTGRSSKGPSHIKDKSISRNENLEISKVEEKDGGKFVCKANGKSVEQTLTVISVSVVPSGHLKVGTEATLQCRISGLSQTFKVKWLKPDGEKETSNPIKLEHVQASHGGTWQLQVTNENEFFIKNLSITVTGLKPTTPAPHQLIPQQPGSPNSKDVNNPTCNSTCSKSRPPEGAGKLTLLGLIWWVWVAIGVGSLIVILLIVVVIVTVMRIRRKKRMMKMKAMMVKSKKYCQCERQTAAQKPRQGRRGEKPPALPLQPLLKK